MLCSLYYRLMFIADAIYPKNTKGWILYEYGPDGRNGKSTMQGLLADLLGEANMKAGSTYSGYHKSLPHDLITQRGNGKPNSDALMGGLFARILEFADVEDPIYNFAILKQMVGRDVVHCTAKYLNDVSKRFKGSVVIHSNKTLRFCSSVDKSKSYVTDRIRVIEYKKSYKSMVEYDPTNSSHLLQNDDVIARMSSPRMLVALFRLLMGVLKYMQKHTGGKIVWSEGEMRYYHNCICHC